MVFTAARGETVEVERARRSRAPPPGAQNLLNLAPRQLGISARKWTVSYVNEGVLDRVIRGVVGVVLAYAARAIWPGTLSLVLLALAAIAFITAIVGWSLPYALLDISTNKKGK